MPGPRISYKAPHPSSKLSYFLRGFEYLDANSFSPTFTHIPMIAGADRDTAFAIEQNNEFFDFVKTKIQLEVAEELGVSGATPTGILAKHIARVVNDRLQLLAISNQMLDQISNGGLASYVSSQTRVINAYLSCFHGHNEKTSKNRRYASAAADLNAGIARKSENQGLTTDHILRADARYLKECMRAAKELHCGKTRFLEAFKAMMWRDQLMVRALDELWKQAKHHDRFKSHRGEALADAIHDFKGIPQCVDWWVKRNQDRISYA